jgi:transposase-like protein
MLIRVKGRYAVLWNLLDSETRFYIALQISSRRDTMNAQMLLRKGTKRTSNRPKELISDGLQSYARAIEREFKNTKFGAKQGTIHRQGPLSEALNNKMERFHGTVRSRLKTMHHLGNEDTAETFARGFAAHYNFIKRHKALNGKTPAQAAKITSEKNTWLSLIQKAKESNGTFMLSNKIERKTN